MCDRIRRRIESGVNVDDNPAKALKPGYEKQKARRGLNPIRDWTWRGGRCGPCRSRAPMRITW